MRGATSAAATRSIEGASERDFMFCSSRKYAFRENGSLAPETCTGRELTSAPASESSGCSHLLVFRRQLDFVLKPAISGHRERTVSATEQGIAPWNENEVRSAPEQGYVLFRESKWPPSDPDDVSDELSPDLVRHAGRSRRRASPLNRRRRGQSGQPGLSLHSRPRRSRNHRQSESAAPPARPVTPRRCMAPGHLGRSPGPHRRADAIHRPGSGRDVVRAWAFREQLRHPTPLAPPAPLLEPLWLSVVEPDDHLLGPRCVRARPDRRAGNEYQGRHGRARRLDRPVGRESGEPAEHWAVSRGGEETGGVYRHHRCPADRGGGS